MEIWLIPKPCRADLSLLKVKQELMVEVVVQINYRKCWPYRMTISERAVPSDRYDPVLLYLLLRLLHPPHRHWQELFRSQIVFVARHFECVNLALYSWSIFANFHDTNLAYDSRFWISTLGILHWRIENYFNQSIFLFQQKQEKMWSPFLIWLEK